MNIARRVLTSTITRQCIKLVKPGNINDECVNEDTSEGDDYTSTKCENSKAVSCPYFSLVTCEEHGGIICDKNMMVRL